MDKRLGCKFCFSTLDPSDAAGEFRIFVRCTSCGALYHETCWPDSSGCIVCEGTEAESIDLPQPGPLWVSNQRRPLQNEIYGQTAVHVHSGPSLTKLALILVTLVAVGSILWWLFATGNQDMGNSFVDASGPLQAQTASSSSAASNVSPETLAEHRPEGPTATPTAQRILPTATQQPSPTPQSLESPVAEVIAENLNIRTGPGTEYAKLGILRNGSQVRIVGKNNGWWQVRLDNGSLGWISIKYAPARGAAEDVPDVPAPPTPTPEPTATPAPPTAEPVRIAVITNNRDAFSESQGANGWSYLVENGRNSGNFSPMPRFDGRCWRSDNWEQDMRICADGEVHPGQSGRIAYQWRIGNSGQLKIDIHAHKIDTRCGDGVWVGTYRVADERVGPRSLGNFQISGGDNKGKTASYSEFFDQGNLLLVMVDIRGESTCDLTRLQIDIR